MESDLLAVPWSAGVVFERDKVGVTKLRRVLVRLSRVSEVRP